MTISISYKSILLGFLTLLGATGAAAVYVWMESFPLDPDGRSGQQIFLLLFAPYVAAGCLFYAILGILGICRGFIRYGITETDLTVRNILHVRVIPWASIQDFLLPPAAFPRPPESLVLILQSGRRVCLPLKRFHSAGADPLLVGLVPGLAAWGLERTRTPMPTTLSPHRVRWQLHKSSLVTIYGATLLFLLVIFAILLNTWNLINYLRICQSHMSAPARISEITRHSGEHDTMVTTVRFTAWNGQNVRLHRDVALDFADTFKVGDQVTVDYLPGHPSIGRIPTWDLDSRQWVMLFLYIPVAWLTHRAVQRSAANWLRPLRETVVWTSDPSTPNCAIADIKLETLAVLLPDHHRGTLILKPPPAVNVWARRFKRAGLEARQVLKEYLILSPEVAQALFDRLGEAGGHAWEYLIFDGAPSTDDVELFLKKTHSRSDPAATSASRPGGFFFHFPPVIGPLDDVAKRGLFQDWIADRLHRLYGGITPPEVPEVDFASLFSINPADGSFAILIERRRSGPRVYLRRDQEARAHLAECQSGNWVTTGDVFVPRVLKRAKRNPRLRDLGMPQFHQPGPT